MRKFTISTLILCGISLICSQGIDAQETDTIVLPPPATTAGLPSEEVEVVKDFRARLAETNRVKIIPELPLARTSEIPYFYEVNVRGLALNYPPPVIRPIALPAESKEKFYNTRLKFAYGYPRFSEASVNSSYNIGENLKVGLLYDHLGAKNKARSPSKFSRHNGQLFGEYTISDISSIKAGLRTDIDSRDILTDIDTIVNDRRTSNYGFFAQLSRPATSDSKLKYNLGLDYNRLSISDLSTRENSFDINLGVSTSAGKFDFGAAIISNRVAYSADTSSVFSAFTIAPKVGYHDLQWNISAGANILFEEGNNYILPDVTVRRAILGPKMHIRVFAKSELTVNSYRNSLVINPYLADIDSIRNQKETSYGLGFQGKHDRLEYNIEGGYKLTKDQLEFTAVDSIVNTSMLWNARNVDSRSPYVELFGSYKLNPTIKLVLNALYQDYKDSNGDDIFGYYDFRLGAGAEFGLLSKKLTIHPRIDLFSNLATEFENANISFIDVQLDASYAIRENVSLYINIDNMLNSHFARWHRYDALGISINGGASVRF